MEHPSPAGSLPRRDFLKLAGAGATTVALPPWGPYSKKHSGISHIPDVRRGLSFDFSIFPLPAQGPVKLPSVTEKSGVHPWAAWPTSGQIKIRRQPWPAIQRSGLHESGRTLSCPLERVTGPFHNSPRPTFADSIATRIRGGCVEDHGRLKA